MIDYDNYRFSRTIDAVQMLDTPVIKEKKWLDIGCHNGYFARLLTSRGYSITGLDIWNPNLKTDTAGWEYLQLDLNKSEFPFENAVFDIISALEVIEHIIDTDRFLDEVYRVLKPGGLLALSTVNINMLKNRFRIPLGFYPYGGDYRDTVTHVRLYNLKCLLTQLAEHNFMILLAEGIKFLPLRYLGIGWAKRLSEFLAKAFPSLCPNLFIVARHPEQT